MMKAVGGRSQGGLLAEQPAGLSLHVRLPADAAQLIGIAGNEAIMKPNKPVYGQADAPRQRFKRAATDLGRLGLRQHP